MPEIDNRACPDDDTVSLVDLVAVLLKYRRLIIVSTLAAAALAMAAYLIYPPYSLAKAESWRVVEVNASMMLESSLESSIGETEGLNFVTQSLLDTSNIVEALRGAGYETVERVAIGAGADEDKAFYTIRRRFVENRSANGSPLKETNRAYSVKVDKGVVSIMFKNGDAEKAKAFIAGMIDLVRRDLCEFSRPKALSTIASYERLLAIPNPSEAVETSIAQGYRDYSAAKALIEGASSPLTVLRRPYVLVPVLTVEVIRADLLKKCVLLVFGVFFLAVFGAFVLNYVDTVKRDPEAMGKIRSALKR
ncbi:MAG TPA: hypothetical protein PLQ29_14430, partial [Spirochaetales bacterium]|nr:hypothetical protein [Spirochaetales bacterium]